MAEQKSSQKLSQNPGFRKDYEIIIVKSIPSVIANFNINNWPIEIFGQTTPNREQNAYLHMIAEYHLLTAKGARFKTLILELKKQGMKTEPAFAKALGIEGDPYEELLKLKR